MAMSIERFAAGLGIGLATSLINKAFDPERIKEGGDGFVDVSLRVSAWTGMCILGSIYLEMPAFVPVVLAVFMRVGVEAEDLIRAINSWTKKE